jgi:putative endonuclease
MHKSYVYILTNQNNTVLYVGVTNDIAARFFEHLNTTNPRSFTARYNVDKLVYFEEFDSIITARRRELFLKKKTRKFKINLINQMNPYWLNLSHRILDQ